VSYGRGGAHELRCSDCYSSAVTFKIVGVVVGVVIVVGVLIFVLSGMR